MSIEPLLIRDDGPDNQHRTHQAERELDRDAKREAYDHGAILMTELACVGRRRLLLSVIATVGVGTPAGAETSKHKRAVE